MRKYQQQHDIHRSRPLSSDTNQHGGAARGNSAPVLIPPESLLDINGLCQFLKLGKTKIFWLINREGLPVHKFGRAYRFDRIEVWQWLQNRRDLV